ncbi:DNA sulfur modification protein DndD [Caballeronia sp. LZ043]|uniref:DNA sulfur modification protein DndD n=1 Tax=Caballeronia sp. LZ043 TaxID=3038569 RepID=UPI0028591084|nr:DNA sulfur modification protein DndD [Caballeronia sp. LZ043]MDR5819141.1 DNA sulfur modification protein DndD [Caballeronia sp. LZ043]
MWISNIELTNFKSYRRETFEFPSPSEDRNLVLIGGLNGFGKTTILEALYLCLYGKDALVHLARAGLKADDSFGYPTFLERAFNGEARHAGAGFMSVRVRIHRTKLQALDVTRKWFFKPNGSWAEDEALARLVTRDIPGSPRIDGQNNFSLTELLDEFFLPAHIAPFFFFDGEEVKKLADQSRVEQVKQGLEGLLGVVLLRALSDRLKNFESIKRSGVINVDQDKLELARIELTRLETELEEAQVELKSMQSEADRIRNEREDLISRMTALGAGSADVSSLGSLIEERQQFRNELGKCHQKLEAVLAGKLPFHLTGPDLLSEYRTQIHGEARWYEWEADRRALEPRIAAFEEAFFSSTATVIRPPLTASQCAEVREGITRAWTSLFHPPPPDAASEIEHKYLRKEARQETLQFLDSLDLSRRDIDELLQEQESLQRRIEDLERQINRLEGLDRDGTLAALKRSIDDLSLPWERLQEAMRASERRQGALDHQIRSLRPTYQRERQNSDKSNPARSLIEKSERVRRVINEVIPKLFPLKVQELAREMTKIYKALAHKDIVDRIDIHDDGRTRLLDGSGKEIMADRSAGENQIFATALIAGLARVSRIAAPLVVDTPLGRLDSKHRENILRFWTSDPRRQVILLSQDEEIDPEFFKRLEGRVCKSYLLEHVNVGHGIGRTSAKEDSYFSGARDDEHSH